MLIGVVLLQVVQGVQAPRFPDFPKQDALSYALDLKVDFEAPRLSGTVAYEIKALADLTHLRFHCTKSKDWRVAFKAADGSSLTSTWEGDELRVALPKPVVADTVVRVTASLSGLPKEGFYFKVNRYGRMMAYTDHYSIGARRWLPCEDHPNERSRWRLRLRYPKGMHATAYGALLANRAAPGEPGFQVLETDTPVEVPSYMFAVVVGRFARIEEPGDPRLLPHLVYEEDAERARPALVHHGRWLQRMEETFGRYAYKKYMTAQCPTRWGGFEAPGNVQLSERIYDGEDRGVGILAHEFVHMWFGDAVGYARWREVWLSEGFASYFGPWLHADSGGPTLQDSMRRLRDRWRRSRDGRVKTVRDDSFPHPDMALNANTYPKGAWVLHMLRKEIGDQAFFRAIRTYYERFRNTSVVTDDFVSVVEEISKQELSWFFEQWLNRKGCPELRVGVFTAPGGESGVRVEQLQAGEPYRFWLRLKVTLPQGQDFPFALRVDRRRQEILLPKGSQDLVVDPDVETLFRLRD